MSRSVVASLAILMVAVVASSVLVVLSFVFSTKGCPIEPRLDDSSRLAIDELDKLMDLDIKLATGLAALGAGLLLGTVKGPRFCLSHRLLIATATYMFACSMYFAFATRYELVQMFVNSCKPYITEKQIQLRFQSGYYFFVAGAIMLAITAISISFRGNPGDGDVQTD